ncbi:MAG: DnaJ domain-containing protein [bacterium]
MKDLYHTLGVNEDASTDEIKKAFRNLAKQYHPDSGNGDSLHFREITHAYKVLSHHESRHDYDRTLRNFRTHSGDFSSYAPQQFEVDASHLQRAIKEIINMGNLTRVRIKRNGKVLLDLPFATASAVTSIGFILSPFLTILVNMGVYRFFEMEVINLVTEEYEAAAIAHQAGRLIEAEKAYQRCIGMSEYFVPAHLNLGLLYRQLGENRKAIECFRQVLEVVPYGEIGKIAQSNLRELQGF